MNLPAMINTDPSTRLRGRYELGERIATPRPWILYRAADRQSGQSFVLLDAHADAFRRVGGVEPYLRVLGRWQSIAHPALVAILDFGAEDERLFVLLPDFSAESLLPGRMEMMAGAAGLILEQTASALEALHGAGLAHGGLEPEMIVWQNSRTYLLPPAIDSISPAADQGPDFAADLDAWARLANRFETLPAKWIAIRDRVAIDGDRQLRTAAELARAARRPAGDSSLGDLLRETPAVPEDTILTLSVLLRAAARFREQYQADPILTPEGITLTAASEIRLEPASGGGDGVSRFLSHPRYACPDPFHLAGSEVDPAKVAIYTAGFMFYELLLGRALFAREMAVERNAGEAFWYGWHADRTKRARRLDAVMPDFPFAVASLIETMIEKDPAGRAGCLDQLAGRFQRLALPTADYAAQPGDSAATWFGSAATSGDWTRSLRRWWPHRGSAPQSLSRRRP